MEKRLNAALMLELMQARCGGNYNRFARELGIDPGHLHRFLKSGVGGGKKIIFGLMDYCQKNGIDYRQYLGDRQRL